MATLSDAIELLRDPGNLKELSDGDSTHGMAVRSDQVVQLLRERGSAPGKRQLA